MSKLTGLLLVIAIAGCATTPIPKFSALRIDATNVSTFEASVNLFQHSLSADRRLRFAVALQEIWDLTGFQAGADSSVDEKTRRYFAKLDGLSYAELISLAGPAAEKTYTALVAQQSRDRAAAARAGDPGFSAASVTSGPSFNGNSGPSNYAGQFPAWIAY